MKKVANVFNPMQVAALCGVGFRTVSRWIRRGKLKGNFNSGNVLEIEGSDLLVFLEGQNMKVPKVLRFPQSIKKAFIIEDDHQMANAIERTLVSLGFVTKRESSGLKALREVIDFAPDLITLDLNIEDLHGNEMLSLIGRFQKDAGSAIVIISGASEEDILKGLEFGCKGFLKKPFSPHQLAFMVRQVMKKSA